MSRILSKLAKSSLEKARESALLAVEVYNKPAVNFRTGGYISLINIAWTALFHAIFFTKNIKPYYRKQDGRLFEKIEGDYKHWELSECIKQYWKGNTTPERKNLEFINKLRNKIEHRTIPEIDTEVFGECQACLLNFEEMLIKEFGEKYSINTYLTFPLQISRIAPIKQLKVSSGWKSVSKFIADFRSSLSTNIFSDNKYSFQIFLVPKIGNRPTRDCIAVEFIQYDQNKPEEMAKYEKVTALIKDRYVPVRNMEGYKPGDVVKILKEKGHSDFSMLNHIRAWKYFKIRPSAKAQNPAKCISKYCTYDKVHKDYVYSEDWIKLLNESWSDDEKKQEIIKVSI